ITRRSATATLVGLAALPLATQARAQPRPDRKDTAPMYGLIGKMRAQPGQRDALIAILLEGTAAMPGCLSYGIAKDRQDADALWVREAWIGQASRKGARSVPAVRAAGARGRPLIAGFGERFETEPVGGHGTMAKQTA